MFPLHPVLTRTAVVVLSSGIALLLATFFRGAPDRDASIGAEGNDHPMREQTH